MTNTILRLWKSLPSDDPLDPMFEAAPILMHSIDEQGILLKVSRFWADMLGYTVDEMVGRRSVEFLTEESANYARTVVLPEFYAAGSIYNVEYDFVCKDGRTLPVLMSAIGQYDLEGRFVRSLAIMFDNSEAKRISQQLLQNQRNDAIGALAGGVAHDFNNLLAVVQGNLEFLLRDPDDPERMEFINSAMQAAKRGAALTQHLLSYGRRARLVPEEVDLNTVLVSADRLVRRLFPPNIVLETVAAGGLWRTNIDAAQLETAVLNILNNARDAMPDGGRITMETRNVRLDEAYINQREEEIAPGRYVMLAVTDTGAGMSEDELTHIFDPFFTTKMIGEGSGLGLSMVFGFMRQSNGSVRAYSEPGVGTAFRLYFPAHPIGQPGEAPKSIPQTAQDDGKTILLAEDEPDVRRVLARQLRDARIRVIEVASGDEALEELRQGLKPDLLVTDIVMPGSLQGPELAERARQLHDDLPVLFVSGYPTEAAIHGNGLRPEDHQLIKPVSRADFLDSVARLLRASAAE